MITLKRKYPKYSCILPSKEKTLFFRPFVVNDEKNLILIKEEKDNKTIFDAILNLISDCFDDIEKMSLTLQDMEYLFCMLRAKSVGESVLVNFTCPITKEKIRASLDITKLEIVKGTKQETIIVDESTKILLKEPSIKKILSINGNFDKDHFVKASISKVYSNDEVYDLNDVSEEEIENLLKQLTINEYDLIKNFVSKLPKIVGIVSYVTKDGEERKIKLEGLFNFFTIA
jgi:hypothetical protein